MNQLTVSTLMFDCPMCKTGLEIPSAYAGAMIVCGECGGEVFLPASGQPLPCVVPVKQDGLSTVSIGARGVGNFQAQMKPEDAGRMGMAATGGFLALLGVIIAGWFGFSHRRGS